LFALIERVKGEPAKGKTKWHVTTTWQGQTRSRAEVASFEIGGEKVPRQFSIDIDEPRELGGSNGFANPQEHLIAALNACMTVGYVAQCAVRGINLESPGDRDRRFDRSPRLSRDRSFRAARLREPELHRSHQGQRHQGAVCRDPPGGNGDLAQFLQHVTVRRAQTDAVVE
jgi:hypothetical protein